MATVEGETLASVPPLRPAPVTVAQILLLEIHSQLNRKAQRENGGLHNTSLPAAPSGPGDTPARATARPTPGPGLPGEDGLPPSWKARGGAGSGWGVLGPARSVLGG